MGFSNNGLPLGPNGSFPRQRIGNAGTVSLSPVRDIEGQYMENEVAQLPTQEKEYSSVVNRAKEHVLFGEVKRQSNMKKMGGGGVVDISHCESGGQFCPDAAGRRRGADE